MVLIYEKLTSFNLLQQIKDFKSANFKNIKYKISQINEFNKKNSLQTKKIQSADMLISQHAPKPLFLRKTSINFKNVLDSVSLKNNTENNGYFTLIYDEVVDFLNKKNKIKPQTIKLNKNKSHLFINEEEDDFFEIEQLFSPKTQVKKEEIKLLRSLKVKKEKKKTLHSRSVSHSPVNFLYFFK